MSEGTVYNAQGRLNRLSVLCIDAYGVAVKNGFKGTVEEWLDSLVGKNAYEYAKDGGYIGTESDFAAKLAAENPTVETWTFMLDDGTTTTKNVGVFMTPETFKTEMWTFTLEDGSTVTKNVGVFA